MDLVFEAPRIERSRIEFKVFQVDALIHFNGLTGMEDELGDLSLGGSDP